MKNCSLIAVSLIFLQSCYKDIIIIPPHDTHNTNSFFLGQKPAAIDVNTGMILYTLADNKFNQVKFPYSGTIGQIVGIKGELLPIGDTISFDQIKTTENYPITIRNIDGQDINYLLHFTSLPVIQVFTTEEVVYKPKVWGRSIITFPGDKETINSVVGIETRGGQSTRRPKSSYSIRFWHDDFSEQNNEVNFFGIQPEANWILDAQFVDPSRMRNLASFDIWKMIQEYPENTPKIPRTHISGNYVELFINNEYQGVYMLNERFDEYRMGIVPSENNLEGLIFKSEDWKGPTIYTGMERKTGGDYWAGWELRYPKDFGDLLWEPFYEYLEFAILANDEEFIESIDKYLSLESAIDYYIFMNLIQATDNNGKNIIMARYDSQSPFIFVPWDLDATWGRDWEGNIIEGHHLLTFALFDRLKLLNPENFRQRLAIRWLELRQSVLNERTMTSVFERYANTLLLSGGYFRELNKWPESELNIEFEMDFISDWIITRLPVLDTYFEEFQ